MTATSVNDPAQTPVVQRQQALARWEAEGGAGIRYPSGSAARFEREHRPDKVAQLQGAELSQLRVRVLALENLVIELLSHAGVCQRELAVSTLACLPPRQPDASPALSTHIAAQMLQLVERSGHLHGWLAPPHKPNRR